MGLGAGAGITKATLMTHGARLFEWLPRDAGSAPEGAGRALGGYAHLIRNGGNLKERAKSTGGLDNGAPAISGCQVWLPRGRPSPWGCVRDIGWKRYRSSQRQAEDGSNGGKESKEHRRELNLIYFFYVSLPLREKIPMDFWPLSSKKKNTVTLLNNKL